MDADVIRAGGLAGYRQLLREMGHDPAPLLAAAGLSGEDLDDPDRYLPYAAVIEAIEAPARTLGIFDFGLRLAARQDISVFGTLAFTIQNARSVHEGISLTAQYLGFQTPAARLRIFPGPGRDEDRITYELLLKEPPPAVQATERAVGLINNTLKLLSNGTIAAGGVAFRHDPVASAGAYQSLFGVMPVFGAGWDGVWVGRQSFRAPLPQRSRMLTDYARRFVVQHAMRLELPADRQLKTVLRDLMRTRTPVLRDAAHAVQLHPRTLQRRLSACGVTFETLRDEVRRELADTYLAQPQVRLAYVASLLGYADQSVLTRSCHRWFGCSPRKRRRMLLDDGETGPPTQRGRAIAFGFSRPSSH